jgi:uncharacterized protein (DUF4415 family)
MKTLLTGLVLAGAAFTTPLAAQQHPVPAAGHAAGAGMPAMSAHMHTMDSLSARLDTAVARMNRATGEARTSAMQDVLRELVAAHRQMHAHMSMMASHHPMGDSVAARSSTPHQHQTPPAARPDSAGRPRK